MEPAQKKTKHECENCKQTFNRAGRLQDHIEKGCNRTTCTTCSRKFISKRDLQRHQENAEPEACDSCDTIFCHESELNRHKRTAHVIGGTIRSEDDEMELDLAIAPRTGLEEEEGYKEAVKTHWGEGNSG